MLSLVSGLWHFIIVIIVISIVSNAACTDKLNVLIADWDESSLTSNHEDFLFVRLNFWYFHVCAQSHVCCRLHFFFIAAWTFETGASLWDAFCLSSGTLDVLIQDVRVTFIERSVCLVVFSWTFVRLGGALSSSQRSVHGSGSVLTFQKDETMKWEWAWSPEDGDAETRRFRWVRFFLQSALMFCCSERPSSVRAEAAERWSDSSVLLYSLHVTWLVLFSTFLKKCL